MLQYLPMTLSIILGILSAVFAALVTIFGKIGMDKGADPIITTTIRSVIMTLFLLLVTTSIGKWGSFSGFTGREWLFITLSGIAGALSWLVYFIALKHGNTTVVGSLDRLSIVFIFILSLVFLGDVFTWKGLIGSLLILTGILVTVLK